VRPRSIFVLLGFLGVLIAGFLLLGASRSAAPASAADKNCSDFSNQAQAQAFFISAGGPSSDPNGLDADHDGVACESLPCPCSSGSGGGGSGGGGGEGGATCGVERWPVKTLSDGRADQVRFKPKKSSINSLISKPAPTVGFSTPRIKGVETTTYRIRATLVQFAREDDRDIHLVVASPKDPAKTMIVEFPDITCPGARKSAKKTQMGKARSALIAACGAPSSSFAHLTGAATIKGVGFFDVKHGQTGVAPNGIELHPVLGFKSTTCSR
jgi:hypothetical protein